MHGVQEVGMRFQKCLRYRYAYTGRMLPAIHELIIRKTESVNSEFALRLLPLLQYAERQRSSGA